MKNLLFFGRGHPHPGAARARQELHRASRRSAPSASSRPLPADLDYGWDIDSYFLYDLPAAVAGVKRITRRERIFYCGHSMGGMLGYGYAGIHDDFEGLITIGAPADLGRGFPLLRAAGARRARCWRGAWTWRSAASTCEREAAHAGRSAARARALRARPRGWPSELRARGGARGARFHYVPVDAWLKFVGAAARAAPRSTRSIEQLTAPAEPADQPRAGERATTSAGCCARAASASRARCVEQFARWIRRGEMVCYRTGYDFKRGFSKIEIPMAIIFGDLDPLASVESTRSVYRAAQSEYLLWRPVKGNSHIELTMGHDIRQICYDIKNLIEYARTHRTRTPSAAALALRRATFRSPERQVWRPRTRSCGRGFAPAPASVPSRGSGR